MPFSQAGHAHGFAAATQGEKSQCIAKLLYFEVVFWFLLCLLLFCIVRQANANAYLYTAVVSLLSLSGIREGVVHPVSHEKDSVVFITWYSHIIPRTVPVHYTTTTAVVVLPVRVPCLLAVTYVCNTEASILAAQREKTLRCLSL